jgi:hypothetical protein
MSSTKSHLQAVNSEAWVGEADAPPTAPQGTAGPPAGGSNPPSGGNTNRAQKQRAERSLPTDRLSFEKQVEVLRIIAQMRRPVLAEDLSAAVGLKGNTGGLSNKFFRDSGWINPAGRGAYTAADVLVEYHRHLNVDPDDTSGARRYLAESARDSWYWRALEPMLEGGVRQTLVLHTLSKEAGAYDHTQQLLLILEWLEWLGMIRRDGETVLPATSDGGVRAQTDTPADEEPDHHPTAEEAPASQESDPESVSVPDHQAAADNSQKPVERGSASAEEIDTSALVSFSFNVRITADDASKLSAEQLKALLEFAEKLRG